MSPQISSIATRRQAVVGAASVIITAGIGTRASALPWATIVPWAEKIAIGVAVGWLVETLKNWGLVPGARANPTPTSTATTLVYKPHQDVEKDLKDDMYSLRLLYSGDSAAGAFALSEARWDEDFVALATTHHHASQTAPSTCTLQLDKADAVILGLVAKALRQRGFSSYDTEAAGHPIHPSEGNELVGDWRYSPKYLTPSGGKIVWKTNVDNPRPNAIIAVRCGIIRSNVHVAQKDNGGYVFEMRPPVDI